MDRIELMKNIVATLDNKKLFAESLKYNYSVNNTPVRGRVRRG